MYPPSRSTKPPALLSGRCCHNDRSTFRLGCKRCPIRLRWVCVHCHQRCPRRFAIRCRFGCIRAHSYFRFFPYRLVYAKHDKLHLATAIDFHLRKPVPFRLAILSLKASLSSRTSAQILSPPSKRLRLTGGISIASMSTVWRFYSRERPVTTSSRPPYTAVFLLSRQANSHTHISQREQTAHGLACPSRPPERTRCHAIK